MTHHLNMADIYGKLFENPSQVMARTRSIYMTITFNL